MGSLPDALHVGFSKCASTFLQAFFRQHPDIFLVEKSHFFTPFENCSFSETATSYSRLFRSATDNQICLESDEHIVLPVHHPVLESAATTLESIAEVCRRIKSVQPHAKILIVVRNQVDLIVSRYSEYILTGGTREFENFVDEFLACSTDGSNYYQNYYFKILELFRLAFSSENVLMIFQEELKHRQSEVIEEICRFLGVANRHPNSKSPRSKRLGLSRFGIRSIGSLNRLVVSRPAKSYRRAFVMGPYPVYKGAQIALRIADYYLPKSLKGEKGAVLSERLKARIRNEFESDNLQLAKALGKNLPSYGY